MSYTITKFGSTTLPIYKPTTPVGTHGSRIVTFDLASGGVLDALGSEISPADGEKIRKRCSIVQSTAAAVDTEYKALRALRGTRAQLWRQWADGTQEWVWARLDAIGAERRAKHLFHLDLDLTFIVLSPCWYSQTETTLDFPDLGADDDDLTTTGSESGGTVTIYSGIANDGNINQPDVTFKVTPVDVAVTSITVTNSSSGHAWTYAGSIAATKTLVVDCGAQSVENDGSDDYANFTGPTDKDEWMELIPGTNVFTVEITGATAILFEVEFYDASA